MTAGGIVLCGGLSSRMGQPKAWLPFAGELMLPRIVRIVREVVEPVVVVAAPGQDVPTLPEEIRVVRDAVAGRGPLQGLAAGLAALQGRADAAYLSSCDVPLLKPAFVRRVIASLEENAGAAVPFAEGFHHPLSAAYRLAVLPEVERLLAQGHLRIGMLFDQVPTRLIAAHEFADVDPDLASLRNLNSPADYAAATANITGM